VTVIAGSIVSSSAFVVFSTTHFGGKELMVAKCSLTFLRVTVMQ
jgi:hypothetical protein